MNASAFIAHFRYLNAIETHVIRIYIIILISIVQAQKYRRSTEGKRDIMRTLLIKVFGHAIIYVQRNSFLMLKVFVCS